nr:MAG TPA: hypothetical protein [Caudoviricetes sp.]
MLSPLFLILQILVAMQYGLDQLLEIYVKISITAVARKILLRQ